MAEPPPPPAAAAGASATACDGWNEDADKPFCCCICRDLVYKPVVQACGHFFCFWCLHNSMNAIGESHCPICRRPYMHFPRVSKMLHFMLKKIEPEEYERRCEEIQSIEEESQVFSPELIEGNDSGEDRAEESGHTDAMSGGVDGANYRQGEQDAAGGMLSTVDFLCPLCRRLLHRPVVLSCGEVFCESCRPISSSLFCPICGDRLSGSSNLVCLELHHFLEHTFPTEYKERENNAAVEQLGKVGQQPQSLTAEAAHYEPYRIDYFVDDTSSRDVEMTIHGGIGCDSCGMCPIVGDRYRCLNCTELIGFDQCGTCYQLGGSLFGRFNQQHQSNHQMEKVSVD